MAYGYIVINDGIMPDASVNPAKTSSFEIGLGCSVFAFNSPRVSANFSKTIRRVSSSSTPPKNAKNIISNYAGCDEATIVRKRVIAISKMKLSISGEEFRFRLPE